MENIRKTSLFNEHEKLGGKIVNFAGWALPIQYEGIIQEHEAVRNNAGLFDVSHMGEIEIVGNDAFDFVQYLITNDISNINDYQMAYTLMCNENGTIVDDVMVYKFSENHFLLIVNASNIKKDYNWIYGNKGKYDVDIMDNSDKISQIAIQGPKSPDILKDITELNLDELKFLYFRDNVNIAGVNCIISRSGYTGEDGFEIYMDKEYAPDLWNKLLEVGKIHGIKPAGLGCRDTLRFEANLPLYGNEISDSITPFEACLGFFVKLNKDNFIGKGALLKEKELGPKRKLVGFEIKQKSIPRHGYDVAVNEKNIGFVTTGYLSPTAKRYIGLALIDSNYSELGGEIDILIRNKPVKAEIVEKNFYKKGYKY